MIDNHCDHKDILPAGTLEQFIRQFAQLCAGYHQFLLTHGRSWEAQALPAGIKRGPKKACFQTAGSMAIEDPSLVYVEGLALWSGIPLAHAWVVRKDGLVIDPTWDKPEMCQYFGLAFRTQYLVETIAKEGAWGILPERIPPDLIENPESALHPDWHSKSHHTLVPRRN